MSSSSHCFPASLPLPHHCSLLISCAWFLFCISFILSSLSSLSTASMFLDTKYLRPSLRMNIFYPINFQKFLFCSTQAWTQASHSLYCELRAQSCSDWLCRGFFLRQNFIYFWLDYVVQDDFELLKILCPLQCWDYRCMPHYLVYWC